MSDDEENLPSREQHDEFGSLEDLNFEGPETTRNRTPVAFDTTLPASHEYLGRMDDISGYTYYDDGEIVQTLAVFTSTLVFPGFVLPILLNEREAAVVHKYLEKKNLLVLICPNEQGTGFFQYGVAMQIFEAKALSLKARGMQRCQLIPGMEIKNIVGQFEKITVEMIEESPCKSPLCDTQMFALKAKRKFSGDDWKELQECWKYRKYHLSQFGLPGWFYNNYEVNLVVEQIVDLLKNYNNECIPKDPTKLSYWIAQNYPLNHQERLNLLQLHTTLERLRYEMIYLKKKRDIICSNCNKHLTEVDKIISMSREGSQGNYVNPGGHIYEIVTVSSCRHFVIDSQPSKQFSWFPGYTWTIIQCKGCQQHLGWLFVNNALEPNYFFGLAKRTWKIRFRERIEPVEIEDKSLYAKHCLMV